MEITLTPEDLLKFEEDVCVHFANKEIKAPVHLQHGCFEQLIEIFKSHIEPDDWILTTWRSHCECLLKGVPRDELMNAIKDGRSISLNFQKYQIVSSAIVGGIAPIAVGLGLAIKKKEQKNKVIVFAGEMSFETGIFHESIKYTNNFNLPIIWVCADNDKSVCTPTRQTWGLNNLTCQSIPNVIYYKYSSKWPHAGTGERINF